MTDAVKIEAAVEADVPQALQRLTAAFAKDPITTFLLGGDAGYTERLARFFSLLARARMALGMPVIVARDASGIQGAAMGNTATPPPWPSALEDEWSRLEEVAPGFHARAALYDEIAEQGKPTEPHHYLGVIGVAPALHGVGIGGRLLESFRQMSASDPRSAGVYLETANPANVRFYQRAGFAITGQGALGSATLWCMFLRHELERRDPAVP